MATGSKEWRRERGGSNEGGRMGREVEKERERRRGREGEKERERERERGGEDGEGGREFLLHQML